MFNVFNLQFTEAIFFLTRNMRFQLNVFNLQRFYCNTKHSLTATFFWFRTHVIFLQIIRIMHQSNQFEITNSLGLHPCYKQYNVVLPSCMSNTQTHKNQIDKVWDQPLPWGLGRPDRYLGFQIGGRGQAQTRRCRRENMWFI